MGLEEFVDQVMMLIKELFAHHNVSGHKFSVGPQRTLIQIQLAFTFHDQACSPGFGDPRAINAALFEKRENVGGSGGYNLDVTALVGCFQVMLLQIVAECDVLCTTKL